MSQFKYANNAGHVFWFSLLLYLSCLLMLVRMYIVTRNDDNLYVYCPYCIASRYNVQGANSVRQLVIFLPNSYISDYNICKPFNHQNTCSCVKSWYTTHTMVSEFVSEVESFTMNFVIKIRSMITGTVTGSRHLVVLSWVSTRWLGFHAGVMKFSDDKVMV